MKRCTTAAQNALSAALGAPFAVPSTRQRALSEQHIIELHVRFLTHGFQHIQVPSIKEGRELMATLLGSLDYYHAVACLTQHDEPLPNGTQDMLTQLVEQRYLPNNLEQFFMDGSDFDFLWIELTPDLIAQPWFDEFKSLIIDHRIDRHMPIVCLSYQNN